MKTPKLKFLEVMTPMEKFWVFATLTMFINNTGDTLLTLKFLSFPIFLRLFRKMLKEMGMKNVKKLVKDWEWLLYASFLTYISLNNFGKSSEIESEQTEPEPFESEQTEIKAEARNVLELLRQHQEGIKTDYSEGDWI